MRLVVGNAQKIIMLKLDSIHKRVISIVVMVTI